MHHKRQAAPLVLGGKLPVQGPALLNLAAAGCAEGLIAAVPAAAELLLHSARTPGNQRIDGLEVRRVG